MTHEELFALIVAALDPLTLDLRKERDRRIYAAFVAARLGQGRDAGLEHRLEQLRAGLGI